MGVARGLALQGSPRIEGGGGNHPESGSFESPCRNASHVMSAHAQRVSTAHNAPLLTPEPRWRPREHLNRRRAGAKRALAQPPPPFVRHCVVRRIIDEKIVRDVGVNLRGGNDGAPTSRTVTKDATMLERVYPRNHRRPLPWEACPTKDIALRIMLRGKLRLGIRGHTHTHTYTNTQKRRRRPVLRVVTQALQGSLKSCKAIAGGWVLRLTANSSARERSPLYRRIAPTRHKEMQALHDRGPPTSFNFRKPAQWIALHGVARTAARRRYSSARVSDEEGFQLRGNPPMLHAPHEHETQGSAACLQRRLPPPVRATWTRLPTKRRLALPGRYRSQHMSCFVLTIASARSATRALAQYIISVFVSSPSVFCGPMGTAATSLLALSAKPNALRDDENDPPTSASPRNERQARATTRAECRAVRAELPHSAGPGYKQHLSGELRAGSSRPTSALSFHNHFFASPRCANHISFPAGAETQPPSQPQSHAWTSFPMFWPRSAARSKPHRERNVLPPVLPPPQCAVLMCCCGVRASLSVGRCA